MLTIDRPHHGAILCQRHGRQDADGLTIEVAGRCAPYGTVAVNDIPAPVTGDRFSANVTLRGAEQDITAHHHGPAGDATHTVRVVWDRHSFPRYRVCLDDNSFFLRDIAWQSYGSIFDCHYLAILRRLHETYGAKFTVNIYYETGDGFTLAEFPDRYRTEWAACADWLGLTFHAYADKPDRPYQHTPAEKLIADLDLVHAEIERFAGPQSLIMPTVIHWGMVLPEALPRLYERGVRALSGYFQRNVIQQTGYDVHYWLDDTRCALLERHGRLKDFATGLVFSRVDIVVNNTPVEQVAPTLDRVLQRPEDAEVVDILTHEQYFWPFFPAYLPDHEQRLEAAIRWATEHGYEPVFFHQGLLGAPS